MQVVPISGYRARDTIAVLKILLEQAVKGELAGVALCVQYANGREELLLTDAYRRQPTRAALATGRLHWRSMQMADEMDDTETING